MQRTLLYLLLLIIVGGGVYYFVFSKKDNVYGEKEAGFTVKDTSRIGRVYMVRTNGESILLERTPQGWMVNKKYPALNSARKTLFETLRKQVAQYPVPENMHDAVVKALAGSSVKVEIYDRDGEKMQVFYVGREAHNYTGTYMYMEGAETPYSVHIPGFEGFLTPRYSTDLADWRNRTVVDLQPDQISSVSISYPSEPLNSFTIKQDNGKPQVITEPGIAGTNPLNERRVEAYFKFFSNLNVEGYLEGIPNLATELGSMPKKCIIDITANNGSKQHVEIYWMPLNRRSKNQLSVDPDVPEEFDADRYYAVFNNMKDTAAIQQATFDKIFRKAYEFYEADKKHPVIGIDPNAQ